jgi:hypothetical protein
MFNDEIRVRIKPGMGGVREFDNAVGSIVDVEISMGMRMYRVELDEPVIVPGLGPVRDDLWEGSLLELLSFDDEESEPDENSEPELDEREI